MSVILNLYQPDYIIYEGSGPNKGHYAAVFENESGDVVAAVDIGGKRKGKGAIDGEDGYYNTLITSYDELLPGMPFKTFEEYVDSLFDTEKGNIVVYDRSEDGEYEAPDDVGLSEPLSGLSSRASLVRILSQSKGERNSGTVKKSDRDVKPETVKYSERDDARTDRELLLDSLMDSQAELTDKERQALAGYRQKADDVRQREADVKDALQELDRMVKAGASREAVNKQRTKVSNLQAGLQDALRELTQAETTDKTMLEIIRKEREIQRRRTAMRTRETFTRRELRGRITKLYNDLNRRITNPSEKKNIPPAVMQQAIEVLRAINMDNSQEGSKAGEKLRDKLLELRARYQELENDPDFKAAAVYDPVVAELLENMIENVGDTPINKMSASQMQAV